MSGHHSWPPKKPKVYVRIRACPDGMYEVYRDGAIQGVTSSNEEAEALAREVRRGL